MALDFSQAGVHASVPANDIERAKAFYSEKLGLSPSYEHPWAVVYELAGRTRFSVFSTPNTARGGHTQMGFAVPDVHVAVAELRERGIVFEEYDEPGLKTTDGIADMDGHLAAWFKDSEGNFIELVGLD
jgi:catechol 2,3-dioxygenase-like lactoylglutathione lyase family enzyme